MERIKTIATRDLTKSVVTGGCGECQTSCQSACKTSCGVANQKCENSNINHCRPYAAFAGRHFFMAIIDWRMKWYISIN